MLSESKLDQFAKNVFNENIIKVLDRDNYFTRLIDRCGYKKPPFERNEKSSDKGFKDTVIWLSILDFAKEYDSDKYVLVTKDGAFQKKQDELINEFSEFTKKTIDIACVSEIESLYNFVGIGEPKKEPDVKQMTKDIDRKINDEFINEINTHIFNLTHYIENDPYSEYTGELLRHFIIFEKLDNDKAERIINQISIDINRKYALFIDVDFTKILKEFGIPCENSLVVDRDCLMCIVKDYESVMNNYPEYKESYIELFRSKINDVYVYQQSIDPDNLPF